MAIVDTIKGIADSGSNISGTGPQSSLSTLTKNNQAPGVGGLNAAGILKTVADSRDSFWQFTSTSITASNWNKQFPYQLLVLKQSKDINGQVTYSQEAPWTFTLPIPPQDMTISTPFAVSTQVTMNGIVEEHNGAPIRNISFSGTTGILPNRPTAPQNPLFAITGATKVFNTGILAGTAQSIAGTVEKVASKAAQLFGQGLDFNLLNAQADFIDNPDAPNTLARNTGYYQFRVLQQFLEGYATVKKHSDGRDLRLALAIWKDEAVYLVSPVNFEVRRNAADPLLYNYNIQLKAWKRVTLDPPGAIPYPVQTGSSPSAIAELLNAISIGRDVLEGITDTLEAIRSDVSVLFQVIRQVSLFAKDALGIPPALTDLPANITQDARGAILDLMSVVRAAGEVDGNLKASKARLSKNSQYLAQAMGIYKQPALDGIQPASVGLAQQEAAPPEAGFADPSKMYELMSKVNINSLKLSPTVQKKIQAEIDSVRKLRRADFEYMRDELEKFAGELAEALGAGDDTYNSTYSRPDIQTKKRPTTDDFDALFALNNIISAMSTMAVAGPQESARLQAIDYVAGLARKSGIAFTQPASKFAIPFPYGSTLEHIALRYLGDANRWHEIAALNGLRTPYVDETGFELPLLTNGNGNQIVVGSIEGLYVGQGVTLAANNTIRTVRRITRLEEMAPGMVFVNVDGDPDLARFGPLGFAVLHAYKPDTVNSTMQLYIPSQTPANEQELTAKSIPGVNDFTQMLEAGGVDLLLTQSGDLAITPDGDCKLAIGLVNIVQKIKIAITTPQGALPQHPSFGLAIRPGTSTADMDAKDLLQATRSLFRGDPAFTGIFAAQVAKNGPLAKLGVSVGIAGIDTVIPVSVDVRR